MTWGLNIIPLLMRIWALLGVMECFVMSERVVLKFLVER